MNDSASPHADGDAPGPPDRRILVVDDEPTLRLGFKFALENEGYRVENAGDGDEALERLADESAVPLAAMLLDLRMPGKGGIDVLREMKSEKRYVPTVVVSAYIDSPTAVEAIDLGVTDFLRKPVTPDQVRGVIGKLLSEEERYAAGGGDDGGDAVAHARWHLRRRDVGNAARLLRESDADEGGVAALWQMLSEHLNACRESSDEKTEFASSRFYKAANILDFLAYNR